MAGVPTVLTLGEAGGATSTFTFTVPAAGATYGPGEVATTVINNPAQDSVAYHTLTILLSQTQFGILGGNTPSFSPSSTASEAATPGTSATSVSGVQSSGTSPSESNATASGTSAASSSGSGSSSSNTGLIAAVAVLAALFVIAVGVIIFLLMRRRRRSTAAAAIASSPTYRHDMAESNNKGRGKITSTELEASLLAHGRSAPVLDDKQAHAKFQKLIHEINDWVLTHFRNINPRPSSTSQEVLRGVRNQPHYRSLLQDPRGKFLVLRGIVADGLTDAFDSGEINGFSDVFGMKERFPTNVGGRDKASWRASTVLLLEQDSGYRERQALAVESTAQRINYVASSIAGVEHSEPRLRALTSIVQSAAELALELSKQRMNFVLMHPTEETFDPTLMEDVLQESQAEQLRASQVLSVVFPAVIRYGDENGEGFDRRNIISKALVLAAAEGQAI